MRTIVPPNARLIPNDAEKVFAGKIFDVYQWQQTLFDGSTSTFEMIRRPDTVQTICIKDDKLVILKQLQPNQPHPSYDIPSGRHDQDHETELEAAKRETLEETGMTFSTWKLLDAFQLTSKLDWIIYTFIAYDFLDEQPQRLDAGEQIEVTLMSLDEVKRLSQTPESRTLPAKILKNVSSIDDLKNLPAYQI